MADQTSYTWEYMLKVFAATDHMDGVVQRTDVTSPQWIQARYLITDTKGNNDKRKVQNGIAKGDAGYDMWAEWVYQVEGGGTYSTILGVTCNWPSWDGKSGEPSQWTKFKAAPGDILGPSIWGSCTGNEATAPPTLWDASRIIGEIDTFFVDQRKQVNTWFNDVGGSDSDFQGSAAGRFKEVLYGLENEFIAMHYGLSGDLGAYKDLPKEPPTNPPKADAGGNPIVTKLKEAGDALKQQQSDMYYKGYEAWIGNSTLESSGASNEHGEHWQYTDGSAGGSFASPYTCVHFAFTELVKDLTAVLTLTTLNYEDGSVSADATVSGGGTVLATTKDGVDKGALDAFVTKLEAKAKEKWNSWAAEKLDKAAADAGKALAAAYDAASRLLIPIRPVTLDLPKDKVDPPNTPDGKDGTGGDGSKTDVKGPPNIGGTGGGGAGGGGTGGIGGIGGGTGGKGGGKTGGIGGIGGTGGGGPTGLVPLLDKDGKPLLGKDGKPQMVPPGTRVNDKGQLVDKDGKPLLDKDGKPRTVPPGTVVGQPGSGNSTTGSGSTGTGSGTPFKVPPGSKKNDDGTVTAPDGTLVRDSNGNPVVLGKDRTIAEDGTVRDANGRPVSQFEQLLTDEEHALAGRVGDVRTGGGGSWSGLPGSIGGGGISFGSGGSGGAGSDLFGEPRGGAAPKTVGGVSSGPAGLGVGGRLAETMGVRPTAELAAEEAALNRATAAGRTVAATAAEEAQLMGRGMPTMGGMGGPMMPPMGAGAGAGAPGQGEKERQRTTWLSEDEEVWGTDSGAVTGVIGR
ncbi:hypothetical protein [Kitasatospora sp. NPDC001547]|uniref:hypothetical protein n=1 Tax=Kitasatospora sp. NPDC001547 TaxID=3364015 RepID=UPI0036A73E6F|nr:hypothetical protein KitaXyl93_65190 [Kitasatospora sp. Xyl93]